MVAHYRSSVQTTLKAVIDCVSKSYECHEADPHVWEGIGESGLELLTAREVGVRDLSPNSLRPILATFVVDGGMRRSP